MHRQVRIILLFSLLCSAFCSAASSSSPPRGGAQRNGNSPITAQQQRGKFAQRTSSTTVTPVTSTVPQSPPPHSSTDTDATIAYKTAISVLLESGGLLAILAAASNGGALKTTTTTTMPPTSTNNFLNLHDLLAKAAIAFVIFSSSTIKTWVDGSVGAATRQVSRPNVIPGDSVWYANLKKPWFNPPGWVFPIMWLIVSKPTQFLAVTKIMELRHKGNDVWLALGVYCMHLALGDAWNEVFFGCQRIGLGVVVIGVFYAMLLAAVKLFHDVDPTAARFLLPTCAWVTVATALNIAIYFLNNKKYIVIVTKQDSSSGNIIKIRKNAR